MKRAEEMRVVFMPWAGLVAAIVGGVLAHQFGSQGTFNNCAAISPLPLLIVSALSLLLVILGGLESWRVVKADSETPARKVVAIVSVGLAALFMMAILLPVIASLMLPPCFQ